MCLSVDRIVDDGLVVGRNDYVDIHAGTAFNLLANDRFGALAMSLVGPKGKFVLLRSRLSVVNTSEVVTCCGSAGSRRPV